MKNKLKILKALSDKNRFRIVMILKFKNLCVCELFNILNISGGTLSSHLNILKEAGLISQEKNGRWVEYSIVDTPANISLIELIESTLEDKTLIEKDRERAKGLDRDNCSKSFK